MQSLRHNGFKAWITSEGQKLPVFNTITDDKTVTCWIPSPPNKPFSVWWRKEDSRQVASSGHVFIDGKDVASGVMRPLRRRPVERSSAKVSRGRARPFTFTALELTDDEFVAPVHDDRLNEAGTIRLEVTYVKLGTSVPVITTEVENITIAHERAKKAGAMITTFAPEERIEHGSAVSTSPYYPDQLGPHVTFVFKYHQREMLQAWGIIPSETGRKRSRSDLEEDEDAEAADEEEEELDFKPSVLDQDINLSPMEETVEGDSEPLYDMGETESLFNGDNNGSMSDIDTEGEEQTLTAKEEHEDKVKVNEKD
ncbi:hypothetical protein CPB86DRAFT_707347 [Serendipita vermifera]|nr:hypothetical protein CPB86DRAFT_707347 [Serendipita vermifera]